MNELFCRSNILKVGVDVDIVSIVKKSDVAAGSHLLETVSTQELDASGGVLAPPFSLETLRSSSASDRFPLNLSDLKREEAG